LNLQDKKDTALYRRCDEVLHYHWDPIGVNDIPEARNEYENYLPALFTLLKSGADKAKIAAYLERIQTVEIGLYTNLSKNIEVAELLLAWKKSIFEAY